MDAETKARVFEPFFTTKGPGRGTGLGLATVYGIVKQSQGAITVESEPGRGCTFRIELPQAQDAVTPAQPSAPRVERVSRKATILAVEDEEVVRMVMCSVLEQVGYEVLCAGTPEEALDLASGHVGRIDLLLTDVVMPQMSGPALADEILQLFPEIKILYVSGYSERDMREQGIGPDSLEVLAKPFAQQELLQKVKGVLEEAPASRRRTSNSLDSKCDNR
jgi:CheY-like chemotaxis protein